MKVNVMNTPVAPNRHADHAIAEQFLTRWSPRAFADTPMSQAQLMSVLEAARWAPSASNNQPWRFVWGLRGDAGFAAIAETLVPFNQAWAEKAAALVMVASQDYTEKDAVRSPNRWHAFDAGAAWAQMALQAQSMGLVAHAMGGFDVDTATRLLNVPEGVVLQAVVAFGTKGDVATLPEGLQAREFPSARHPLAQIAHHGSF
jgi:nitroreductase